MRRNLFAVSAVCFLLTAFSACKKDDKGSAGTTGGTYMTAKINGKAASFKFSVTAHRNGKYDVAAVGVTGPMTQDSESLQLVIFDSANELAPGTFQLDGGAYKMLVTYGTRKADGQQVNYAASTASASPADVFEIRLTAIDGNTVKGTFSGKVAMQSGATTVAVADITDGEFSAPFK